MPLAADDFPRPPVVVHSDTAATRPLRVRVCGDKQGMSRGAAMSLAEHVRRTEPGRTAFSAYRCPFAAEHEPEAGDWHVGHGITMDTLVELAEHLRGRHGTMTDDLRSLAFARAATRLAAAARAAHLDVVPAFRAPPVQRGVSRDVRHHEHGCVVGVVLRDRPFDEVLRDMVRGVLDAGDLGHDGYLYGLLWRSVEHEAA